MNPLFREVEKYKVINVPGYFVNKISIYISNICPYISLEHTTIGLITIDKLCSQIPYFNATSFFCIPLSNSLNICVFRKHLSIYTCFQTCFCKSKCTKNFKHAKLKVCLNKSSAVLLTPQLQSSFSMVK